jgi:hypothetical protein
MFPVLNAKEVALMDGGRVNVILGDGESFFENFK